MQWKQQSFCLLMEYFKLTDYNLNEYPVCLANILKGFTAGNMKKTRNLRICLRFFDWFWKFWCWWYFRYFECFTNKYYVK